MASRSNIIRDCSMTTEEESLRRVDIAVLCHNAQTLVSLAAPATTFVKAVDRFRKWESPILCAALIVMMTSSSILLTTIYYLLLSLGVIGSLAGIGIAHLRGNILLKVLPHPISTDKENNYVQELPAQSSHTEMMRQFRQILMYTDRIVHGLATMIDKFYAVLKWDDFNHSVRCYSISAVLVIFLHILPLRWTITLIVDGFVIYYPVKKFIADKYFGDVELADVDRKELAKERDPDTISVSQASIPSEDDDMEEDMSSEKSDSSVELSDTEGLEFGGSVARNVDSKDHGEDTSLSKPDAQPVKSEGRDDVDKEDMDQSHDSEQQSLNSQDSATLKSVSQSKLESHPFRSDGKSGSEGTESAGSDSGSTEGKTGGSPNRPTGVVGRIMEFKRKQQQANTGTCLGCNVNFTTILKRKKNCTYCGNSFCSKCCSNKVPKSLMGVTAPGTQAEQVAVCNFCHNYLTHGDKEHSDGTKLKTT